MPQPFRFAGKYALSVNGTVPGLYQEFVRERGTWPEDSEILSKIQNTRDILGTTCYKILSEILPELGIGDAIYLKGALITDDCFGDSYSELVKNFRGKMHIKPSGNFGFPIELQDDLAKYIERLPENGKITLMDKNRFYLELLQTIPEEDTVVYGKFGK